MVPRSARPQDRYSSSDRADDLLLVAVDDATERRLLEKAIARSEQRYRRLFESAKDGILILDAETGLIVDANPFIIRLLECSHNELMGKHLWEIGLFQDIAANKVAVLELQTRGYIRYDDLPLQSREGRRIDVEFVSNVYQEGTSSVIQCNIRDITERKQMQDTALRQAAALADASRRKDEFLAMLSHELRNPLAPIFNALHILRLQQDDTAAQHRARGVIERQAKQLSRLIDDLLEISRIATGTVMLHLERIDVASVVAHAVETVHPLMAQQHHELRVTVPEQPIWLRADSTRLEQVVVNLLVNAAKYTLPGGRIWLTVRQEGAEVLVRVRDTGVGIAAELLPRVFDLFAQADRSLDRSQGGLGVGLALVRQLVEMHHGKVAVHSEGLNQGSEFVVHLPVMASPAHAELSPSESITPNGRALQILVVDDNEDSANSLAELLRILGHEIQVAHGGLQALGAALAFRPDVMLLDIGLPQMDGYDVARRIRCHPELRNLVLVAITGYGQPSDCRRVEQAGFDHHLVKPVDWQRLREVLASVTGGPVSTSVETGPPVR